VQTFKDGNEVKRINYDKDGKVVNGMEKELDSYGNMTQSWTLDEDMKRERQGFGYHYTYVNKAWALRVARDIKDYGFGSVANLKVREIKGATNASISEEEIKVAMKKIQP
jgi:YbbR domain-containing protein